MSFTVNDNWLSALSPVKFNYNFSDEQEFKGRHKPVANNFFYYEHDGFKNFKDAAISKKSVLVLTETAPLENIFSSKTFSRGLGTISGSFFIKANGRFLTVKNNLIYRGSPCGNSSNPSLITISSLKNNLVEIRIGSKLVEIDPVYPFTAKLVDTETFGDVQYRQFETDFADNKIAFKIKTPIGYRFLAFGIDNTLRAVGVELNDLPINQYHFEVISHTRTSINYGFDVKLSELKEVKYFNSFTDQRYNQTVDIKQVINRDTNYLISCPTLDISINSNPSANIANLKTNYSSTGAFLPTTI